MCLVGAASVEVEEVVGEERPRVVMVSTAVCLTLRKNKRAFFPLLFKDKAYKSFKNITFLNIKNK